MSADAPTSVTALRPSTVLVVEPDPLTARAVCRAIDADARLECVGVVGDGPASVERAAELQPELVATEPRAVAVEDELGLVTRLTDAAAGMRVVMFSAAPDPAMEIAMLRQGTLGIVDKREGIPALLEALARVAAGEVMVSGALAMRVIRQLRRAPVGSAGLRPVRSELTNREWEVLDLLALGRTTREVAERLYLTEDTVYSHVKSLMRKLGVHTRMEAVAAAERLRDRPS